MGSSLCRQRRTKKDKNKKVEVPYAAVSVSQARGLAMDRWCMFCGNCCNDKTEAEKMALMMRGSQMNNAASASTLADWCMFCGNCCNNQAVMMANWCMFCGNCCNELTVEQAVARVQGGNGGNGERE